MNAFAARPQVKSTNGDTSLGGEDFDIKLQEFLIGEF
ncbi:MAG: Hsp70 family protein, partial [Microcystis panniformis]